MPTSGQRQRGVKLESIQRIRHRPPVARTEDHEQVDHHPDPQPDQVPQASEGHPEGPWLGRIGKFPTRGGTPQIRGMVEKVHHLVSVTEA
jgi:hypothetical protein